MVRFPYEAYPYQLQYIAVILHQLNCEGHICIQSDTGTGKCLSLLASLMAYFS